ncbi:predicted protein [Naegleria gruberi]|uniref:RNA-dependent RNA polymerase n=1 Tax=Naegleria gruberi TaxID=5762 RepID=D2VWQ3_NAEGR|nr:uncharacterized protein NAEGRDRAFT_73464 [Naegleria gruberi]EFC38661.1 predicted protein [Naegleria gruberi]|eukprot:XP_002671405.1 predicted protein [Naegleria gruberi strain NEG-M]
MRLFQAVKKDCLTHLKDVVVFSSLGPEFVPSLISGADLDGDHFYIFWDSELVENIQCVDEKEPSSILSNTPVNNNSLNTYNWSCLYTNIPTFSEDVIDNVGLEDEFDNYEIAIKKSYQKLLLALDTFKYCSFSHLLELRRIFVDYFAINWANNNEYYNIMYQIANAITCTIDAPKHGQWKEWKDFLPIISNIPKSPHYLLTGNCTISHSIFGKNVKIECNYDGNGGEAFYLLFENCLKKYDLETYDPIWTSPTLENPIAIDIHDDTKDYRNNLISIGSSIKSN